MTTDKKPPVYSADPPSETMNEIIVSESADLPFSHPVKQDEPDFCYAVIGMLRYKTDYTLIGGQVAPFCIPSTGWVNRDLEFVLYVLLSKVVSVSREEGTTLSRFNIMCAGDPGFGNTMLNGESGIYFFRADSVAGFLGTDVKLTNPVDQSDVVDLIVADNHKGSVGNLTPRPADGKLSFAPKFYQRIPRALDGAVRRYDIVQKRWDWYREIVGPMFLPFLGWSDLNFSVEREVVERRLGAEFMWDSRLYAGTETMMPDPGKIQLDNKEQQLLIETVHDTSQGFAWLREKNIQPMAVRLPRMMGSDRGRLGYLRQTLNAAGLHSWRKILEQ